MILQQPGLGFSLDAHSQLAFLRGWPRKILHFVVYWPVAYLLLRATSRLGTSGFTQFRRKKERYV